MDGFRFGNERNVQSAVLRLGVEAEGREMDTTATTKNRLGGAQRIGGGEVRHCKLGSTKGCNLLVRLPEPKMWWPNVYASIVLISHPSRIPLRPVENYTDL